MLPSIQRGLNPGPTAGWNANQFCVAVRAITSSAPYAVLASELEAECGGGYAGSQVLQAMVREGLPPYSQYSQWARDLPAAVFRASDAPVPKLRAVVMAPTPAQLHCMRELTLPYLLPPADPVGH